MSRCNRHGREGCLCPDGAYTREEAQQRAGLCGPPAPVIHDRASLTARLTFLAVGLTDAGLAALVERAETLTVDHARPLTSGALAKAQQEREAAPMGYAPGCACVPGAMCRPCRTEQAAPMAGKVCVPERCRMCDGAGRPGWPCGGCGRVGTATVVKPQTGGL